MDLKSDHHDPLPASAESGHHHPRQSDDSGNLGNDKAKVQWNGSLGHPQQHRVGAESATTTVDDTSKTEEENDAAAKTLAAKRKLNRIHSKRKRERRRIELQVLEERQADLTVRNADLARRNRRLEELVDQAQRVAHEYEKNPDSSVWTTSPSSAHSSVAAQPPSQVQEGLFDTHPSLRLGGSPAGGSSDMEGQSTIMTVDAARLARMTPQEQRQYYDERYFEQQQQREQVQDSTTQRLPTSSFLSELALRGAGDRQPLLPQEPLSAATTSTNDDLVIQQQQEQSFLSLLSEQNQWQQTPERVLPTASLFSSTTASPFSSSPSPPSLSYLHGDYAQQLLSGTTTIQEHHLPSLPSSLHLAGIPPSSSLQAPLATSDATFNPLISMSDHERQHYEDPREGASFQDAADAFSASAAAISVGEQLQLQQQEPAAATATRTHEHEEQALLLVLLQQQQQEQQELQQQERNNSNAEQQQLLLSLALLQQLQQPYQQQHGPPEEAGEGD